MSCFGDLKDFLPKLSHGEQAKFLSHIDEAAKAHNPFTDDAVTADIDTVSSQFTTLYQYLITSIETCDGMGSS